MNIFLVIVIFCIAFPLFWIAIVFLISRVSGWASVASHYAYAGEPKPQQRQSRSLSFIRLRFLPFNYSLVVNMAADDEALYLSVMKIFALGHTPLRIPFMDISLKESMTIFIPMGHLHLAKTPGIKIAMLPKDITWLEQESGGLTPRK